MTVRFVMLASLTGLLFAACGERDDRNAGPCLGSADSLEGRECASAADAAWKELTSSGPIPRRLEGEDEFSHFMRQVEYSDRRRRSLGLQFWNAYPEDQRRYSWLILAVNLAPHYAEDVREWAKKERHPLAANDAAVDLAARAEWEARYTELRAAFWASDAVSNRQRRLLYYGELLQALRQTREVHARGEVVDAQLLLDVYPNFVRTFPMPFQVQERSKQVEEDSAHRQMLESLWESVFAIGRDVFAWTPEQAIAFIDAVAAETDGYTSIDVTSAERESYRDVPGLLRAHVLENQMLPPSRTAGLGNNEAERIWSALNAAPAAFFPRNPEGRIIRSYYLVIAERRRLELVSDVWEHATKRSRQIAWASQLYSMPPAYFGTAFVDMIRAVASGDTENLRLNEGLLEDWRSDYAKLRGVFWDDPATTEQEKADWLRFELGRVANVVRAGDKNRLSDAEIHRFLNGIQLLYTQFDGDEQAAELIRHVVEYPWRYDLEDDGLEVFLMPFYTSQSGGPLSHVLTYHEARVALKTRPITFAGPLFGGGMLSSEDLLGKIVYIDPWATWCGVCIAAMPNLHSTYLEYKDKGFEFVSLVQDGTEEPKTVRRLKETMKLTWPILVGDEFVRELPILNKYIVLNRDGTVYAFHDRIYGPPLHEILDEMLAAESGKL